MAVREGLRPRVPGAVRYSPTTSPVVASMRASVPRWELAIHTKSNIELVWSSCSWSGTCSWFSPASTPESKSASRAKVRVCAPAGGDASAMRASQQAARAENVLPRFVRFVLIPDLLVRARHPTVEVFP